MSRFPGIALLVLPLLADAAAAQSDAPAIDLPALIECRASPQDWGSLAFSLMADPGAAQALGWSAVPSDNPFLQEYELPGATQVFGRDTKRIALTSSGPLAVFDGVAPKDLASELGVTAVPASPGQFLGEKIVSETTDESDGTKFHTRVSINVSSVASHPGKTLAGCAYVVETVE